MTERLVSAFAIVEYIINAEVVGMIITAIGAWMFFVLRRSHQGQLPHLLTTRLCT
jgi:hypothetical protein